MAFVGEEFVNGWTSSMGSMWEMMLRSRIGAWTSRTQTVKSVSSMLVAIARWGIGVRGGTKNGSGCLLAPLLVPGVDRKVIEKLSARRTLCAVS